MTEIYNVFQLYGGHNNQTPSAPPQVSGSLTFEGLSMSAGGESDGLPMPSIPFSSYNNPGPSIFTLGRLFIGSVINDAPGSVAANANGLPYWSADGAFADNNAEASIRKIRRISAGRNAPPLQLFADGAALVALKDAGDVDEVNGTYSWAYDATNPYQTLAQIGEFYDDPPNTDIDATVKLNELQRVLTDPSSRFNLGIDSGGQPLILDECSFASVGPDARVTIDVGDVGNGVDQIPVSVLDNRARNFRFHPTVFLRRTRYIRSIERTYSDPGGLAQGFTSTQPFNIRLQDEDTELSTWLIIVDGVSSIVTLDHTGLSLRRPRDIWQQLWVPLITGDQSVANLTILGGGGTRGPSASQLRLEYLSYARFLDVSGNELTQEDTDQP